jgi:micrococcal nuclease
MLTKASAICLGLSAATQATAIGMCPRSDWYTCVVDGDTLWLESVNYRLEGYDAPEEYTNACGGFTEIDLARAATRHFLNLLNQNTWELQPQGQEDRCGRVIARIYINGEDVGDILVREGLARYWPDVNEFWCNLGEKTGWERIVSMDKRARILFLDQNIKRVLEWYHDEILSGYHCLPRRCTGCFC